MPLPEDQAPPKAAVELPSYSLEEEEHSQGWRAWLRGRRLVILCSAIAILAVGIFSAKPLYREAKARRALALADEAGQAIDRGDGAEASRLLRQAALMAFQDKRVASRVTLHAARSGDMASVAELGKKLVRGEASSEEALVFGEFSLAAQHIDDAEKATAALAGPMPSDDQARATALRAGVLQSRGQTEKAEEILRQAIAENGGESSDRLRVLLATFLLAEKKPDASSAAEQILEEAAKNRGEQGAAAVRLLCANRAGLSPAAQTEFERTADLLRSHPSASEQDEVFIARLSLTADPSSSERVARSLVSRLNGTKRAGIDTRVAAARLLIAANRLNEVLELVSEEDASMHAGALMARLDALSGLEDWERTSQLIEKHRGTTLPDTLYHLFRARMAIVRGDTQAADEEKRVLRQVMGFAELPHVLFAARYAENVGWKPEALAAWRIIAGNENARPEALRAELRNLPPEASAAEGLEITDELLKIAPDDPSVRLSAAYFRLLAGREIESSAATAEEFLAANPASDDIRRVAALGRLRCGRSEAALDIWPGDNGENRWKALHVALLREAGQKQASDLAAKGVEEESLGPEERDLFFGPENTEAGGKPSGT